VSKPIACAHEWAFTTPGHIRCQRCPAIGQRWLTRRERADLRTGLWLHLNMPRVAQRLEGARHA
jgi:hypothetical protein